MRHGDGLLLVREERAVSGFSFAQNGYLTVESTYSSIDVWLAEGLAYVADNEASGEIVGGIHYDVIL